MSLNYLMSIQYIQYVIFKIYKKSNISSTDKYSHTFLFGNNCTSVSRSFSSCEVASTHLLHTGDISGRVIGSHSFSLGSMVSWLHPGITVVVDCSEVEGTMLALVCVAGTTFFPDQQVPSVVDSPNFDLTGRLAWKQFSSKLSQKRNHLLRFQRF